ncbi:MAG: hypothetical protein OEY03_08955 [Rhizobacter sp.]|nr:hypothetical protein [Rhizobacter sp.]
MNPILGWSLALGALAAGWLGYGWPGLALAATVITFWLLLQFNRALRVMKDAGHAPVGHVPSAVMLQPKLKAGMSMIQLISMTRSLGRRLPGPAESFAWADAGGVELIVNFEKGRCKDWQMIRPDASQNDGTDQATGRAADMTSPARRAD